MIIYSYMLVMEYIFLAPANFLKHVNCNCVLVCDLKEPRVQIMAIFEHISRKIYVETDEIIILQIKSFS